MRLSVNLLLLFYFTITSCSVVKFGILTTSNSPPNIDTFIERYIENVNLTDSMSVYSYEIVKKILPVVNDEIEKAKIKEAVDLMKDTATIFGYVSESLDDLEAELEANNLYFWNAKPNNYECYEHMFFSINKCSTIIQSLRYINGNYSSILLFVEDKYENINCIDNITSTLKNIRNDYIKLDITSTTPQTDLEGNIKDNIKEGSKTAIVALVTSTVLATINTAYTTVATTETWLKLEDYPIISFYQDSDIADDIINIQQFYSIQPGIINELYTVPTVTPVPTAVAPTTLPFELLSTYVLLDMFFTQSFEYKVFNIQMFINSITFYNRTIILDMNKKNLTTVILPNNVINSEIEVYRKKTAGDEYITNFILPKEYIYQYLPGVPFDSDQICHILARNYDLNMKLNYVIIVTYLSGVFRNLDKGVLEGFLSSVNEINSQVLYYYI